MSVLAALLPGALFAVVAFFSLSSVTYPSVAVDSNPLQTTESLNAGASPEQSVLAWNAKTNVLASGDKRTEFHIKQINYRDADGQWKLIDVTPVPTTYGWEVTQSPFTAKFPKRSTGAAVMLNNNRFDVPTGTDIAEPVPGEFLKRGRIKYLRRLVGLAGCGIF
jgi:hypothetical protein